MKKRQEKFISLFEASRHCEYSQEYLSLRARQGKLKSKKIGRNWYTTAVWLNEYLTKNEKINSEENLLSKEAKIRKNIFFDLSVVAAKIILIPIKIIFKELFSLFKKIFNIFSKIIYDEICILNCGLRKINSVFYKPIFFNFYKNKENNSAEIYDIWDKAILGDKKYFFSPFKQKLALATALSFLILFIFYGISDFKSAVASLLNFKNKTDNFILINIPEGAGEVFSRYSSNIDDKYFYAASAFDFFKKKIIKTKKNATDFSVVLEKGVYDFFYEVKNRAIYLRDKITGVDKIKNNLNNISYSVRDTENEKDQEKITSKISLSDTLSDMNQNKKPQPETQKIIIKEKNLNISGIYKEIEKLKSKDIKIENPNNFKTILAKISNLENKKTLTADELDSELNKINNKFLADISDLKNQLADKTQANFNAIALSNRIDRLYEPSISSPTVSGNASFQTLTASGNGDISGNLTVSGYLTVNSTSTLSSDLRVDNGTLVVDALNNRVGIGTTSPNFTLDVNGIVNATSLYVNGSSYIGSQWTTASSDIHYNTGNVGVGTTTPYAKLSVSGEVVGAYFSATTTATSTFQGGIRANLLNITSATATSTFSNGIKLTNGCFLMPDGTCAGAGGGGGSGTVNSGTAGQVSYYAANGTAVSGTSTLFLASSEKVGIGTTTPNWLLQTAGTRPFFTLSDTSAAANLKHWFMSSQGGNLYVGTSSDAYATSTISALTILSNSNVGIGTTSPYAKLSVSGILAADSLNVNSASATSTFAGGLLAATGGGAIGFGTTTPSTFFSVAGHCVTGDTRLRRRRKRVKSQKSKIKSQDSEFENCDIENSLKIENCKLKIDDDYIYDEVQIKDIKPGDEILTLNEKTGKLEYRGVRSLLDMGIERTFVLFTETGKKIRTTANHPYFAKQHIVISGVFEADQSNRIEELNKPTYIAVANDDFSDVIVLDKKLKKELYDFYKLKNKVKFFAPAVWARSLAYLIRKNNIGNARVILDKEYSGYEPLITEIIKQYTNNIDVNFEIIGKKSPAHFAAYGANIAVKNKKSTEAPVARIAKGDLHPETSSENQTPFGRLNISYTCEFNLSRGKWTKTMYLNIGAEIMTVDGWDKIIKIQRVAKEQVYDIEVEGTHNFIGNEIVAHNTYITGGLGAGVTEITNGNITGTGRLAITSTSATSTFSTGGLTVGTSQFVVQQTSGNVGIGTAGPTAKLHIKQSSNASAGALKIERADVALQWGIYMATGNELSFSYQSGVPLMVINESDGNVGIGTTTPNWLLQANGTRPSFVLSDSSSAANLKHWFLSSQGGNFYVGTSSDAYATSTISALTILSNSNIGIGTSSPYAKLSVSGILAADSLNVNSASATSTFAGGLLAATGGGAIGFGTTTPSTFFSVAGHCVTGDTRLKRVKRKRKKKNGEYEYEFEDTRIDEIKPGDEILTLDDKTGKLKVSRIKKLMYMGVKPIVEITTALDRKIRTTAEHPYFVKSYSPELPKIKPRIGIFFDNANMFYAQKKAGWKIDFAKLKRELSKSFDLKFINFYTAIPEEEDESMKKTLKYLSFIEPFVNLITKPLKYIKTKKLIGEKIVETVKKKGDMDVELTLDVAKLIDNIDVLFIASGDSDLLPLKNYALESGKKIVFVGFQNNMAWELRQILHIPLDDYRNVLDLELNEININKKQAPSFGLGVALLNILYSRAPSLSSGGVWKKVAGLKVGQEIAVLGKNGKPIWDKIAEMRALPVEDVYDIEVAGTHNFIGNDIVAHNTYISGGLGAGTIETTNGNITGTGRLAITSTSATSTFSTGGLTVGTSQFVVQQTSGNVGIGTAAPTSKLHIYDTGSLTRVTFENNNASGRVIQEVLTTAGAGGAQFDLRTHGSSYSETLFGNSMTDAAAMIAQGNSLFVVGNYADTDMILGTNNAERIRIKNTGNVGIGTTTPNWLLQANGTRPFFTLSDTEAAADKKHWFMSSQGGSLYIGTSTDSYATTTLLTITGSGIGIGTTTPRAPLEIVGAGLSGASLSMQRTGTNNYIGFVIPGSATLSIVSQSAMNNSANLNIRGLLIGNSYDTTPNAGEIRTSSGQNLTLSPANNPIFTFTTSGNFGISTTTPNWNLQINSTTTRPFLVLSDGLANANLKHWFMSSQGGNLYVGTSSDAYATSTISALTILSNSNVGIGTTSPYAKLSVSGILAADSLNVNSQTATSTFAGGLLAATGGGVVGFGTTTPSTFFSVAGHCVTGDTRLRRRRRRVKSQKSKIKSQDSEFENCDIENSLKIENCKLKIDDDYIYDEVQIKDIKPGDEIASLNEKTGKIVWSRVNGLLDMGIKPIYKLTTASGKTIRTTGEHPYLALDKDVVSDIIFTSGGEGRIGPAYSGIAGAGGNLFEERSAHQPRRIAAVGSALNSAFQKLNLTNPRVAVFIDAANLEKSVEKLGWKLNHKYLKKLIFSLSQVVYLGYFTIRPQTESQENFLLALKRFGYDIHTKLLKIIKTEKGNLPKADVDAEIITEMLERQKDYDVALLFSGDSDYRYPLSALQSKGKKIIVLSTRFSISKELLETSNVYIDLSKIKQYIERNKQKSPSFSTGGKNSIATANISIGDTISFVNNGKWKKISEISEGQFIAVSSDDGSKAIWDKIIKIEHLLSEQVYDIEVEGTHNFIGNDIVAHNTYITGGLGAGVTETTNGNITGTGRLSITSTTATSTFSTGGLTVGTSQFVVQQTSGNVGIGTTTPNWLLQANGTRPSFVLSDSSSAANLKHWFLSSQGGNFYLGTSSDAYATSSVSRFTINTNGLLGLASSSPSAMLAIAGSTYLGTGANDILTIHNGTVNYRISATSTIPDNTMYAWSIGTSTTNNPPIFRIDTRTGSKATTTIIGGLSIDNGAFEYDYTSGITSIDSADFGALSFDTDAGIVSWIDMTVATTAANIINSYTAQLDGSSMLTVYGLTDGSGSIKNGAIGIGTTTPDTLLTVNASSTNYNASTTVLALDSMLGSGSPNAASGIGAGLVFRMTNSASSTVNTASIVGTLKTVTSGSEDGELTFFTRASGGALTERLRIDSSGKLGIGTTTPNWLLQAAGTRPMFTLSDTSAAANLKHWFMSSQGGNFYVGTSSDAYATSTIPAFMINSNGNIGIGTSSPQSKLSIEGTCIDAGPGCADIAELYKSSEDTETGDIMAVDINNKETVKIAKQGDSIIGIVSTNPAMIIEGSSLEFLTGRAYLNNSRKPAIALSGRVPVKISLEGGEIKPGDKIALSSAPGVGMRATTTGVTVGIALESFDGVNSATVITANGQEFKTGKIIVFVNLGYSRLDNFAESGWNIDIHSGKIKSQYILDMSDKEIVQIRAILSASGNWSLDENGKLVVREIETGKLKVGSSGFPTGITIYDEDTGAPYCIKMKGGQIVSITGECGANLEVGLPISSTTPTDTEPPVIMINGNNPATIDIDSVYSDLGATATDNISQNLGIHYKVNGVEVNEILIDTNATGTRAILYYATDEAGNIGTAERQVIVEEAIIPQTTITTPSDTASSTILNI